ncbi:MAG: acetyl ornithine aminotransferase family protein [Deltaproteobacteria bacterium]|nr:acetyl ornithine aminotransferase family protein [Deltaproteobacteria bacterium]
MLDVPRIVVPPPGPKAAEILSRDSRFVSPSYTRAYPLVAARGYGTTIEDVDGNLFLDFTAGLAVCSTGHCHPKVVDAIAAQAKSLIHMSGTDFYNIPQPALAERLASLCPGGEEKKVYFGNSGAEAVEAALKLARHATGRQYVIAFHGAFHGRTYGALSLTASKTVHRRRFSPLVPGVVHAPYAYCYRCPVQCSPETCDADCAGWIEEIIFRHEVAPEEVAAIAVEPVLGEGGYIVPPEKFLSRLEGICRKHGILLFADEVQTGMGRTGRMLAVEHGGTVPDIVALAKAIASGLPLSATIAPARIMSWPPGSHASTFGGNPVACAAAMATLELLTSGLIENSRKMGTRLLAGLRRLMDSHELIGDVRGLGLMAGAELVQDRQTKERAAEERNRLVRRCFEKGLLILPAGACSIRLSPPLVVTGDDIDTALSLLDEGLREISTARKR